MFRICYSVGELCSDAISRPETTFDRTLMIDDGWSSEGEVGDARRRRSPRDARHNIVQDSVLLYGGPPLQVG